MAETKKAPSPQELAMDEIERLAYSARSPKDLQEKGVPVMAALGVNPNKHLGEKSEDPRIINEWYMGQIHSSVIQGKVHELQLFARIF